MKIYIDDPVKRAKGEPEQELPSDVSIRFDVGGFAFVVTAEDGSLSVKKISNGIEVLPVSSNKIYLA